jgi:hypothetical protein
MALGGVDMFLFDWDGLHSCKVRIGQTPFLLFTRKETMHDI